MNCPFCNEKLEGIDTDSGINIVQCSCCEKLSFSFHFGKLAQYTFNIDEQLWLIVGYYKNAIIIQDGNIQFFDGFARLKNDIVIPFDLSANPYPITPQNYRQKLQTYLVFS